MIKVMVISMGKPDIMVVWVVLQPKDSKHHFYPIFQHYYTQVVVKKEAIKLNIQLTHPYDSFRHQEKHLLKNKV